MHSQVLNGLWTGSDVGLGKGDDDGWWTSEWVNGTCKKNSNGVGFPLYSRSWEAVSLPLTLFGQIPRDQRRGKAGGDSGNWARFKPRACGKE